MEWVKLYLSFSYKSGIVIKKDVLLQAIKTCKEYEKTKIYVPAIIEYYKKYYNDPMPPEV